MTKTEAIEVPAWVPAGKTRDCLSGHGNILGHLPNKIGDLTMCLADLTETGSVRFSQFNADGAGNTISVEIGSGHIAQLDAKLA